MGKSAPKAPKAPDPVATAQAQTQMNKETAITQAQLDRINQYTPQGSVEFFQTGKYADGTPIFQSVQSYSPDEQKKYDLSNKVAIELSKLANSNIGRVGATQGRDFNFGRMTPMRTNINAGPMQMSIGPRNLSADGRRVADSLYGQARSRLDPEWQQTESDMRSRLAAQGISENSDAYRRELDNMARAKNDAYNQANYEAIQAGGAEQSRLFGIAAQQGAFRNQAQSQQFNENAANTTLNNQARQQQIEEATYLRNLPLNDIAALLAGTQINDPNFAPVAQVGVAAPDYMGMVQNNYNSALNQYNQQMANRSGALGNIFGAAGSIGGAIAMSDNRLKTAIRRIGTLANGIPTYAFRYIGDKAQRFGVMAQEVFKVKPEAVIFTPSGYMAVDYGKVYE